MNTSPERASPWDTYDPAAIFCFVDPSAPALLEWAQLALHEATLRRDQQAFRIGALKMTIEGIKRLRMLEVQDPQPPSTSAR